MQPHEWLAGALAGFPAAKLFGSGEGGATVLHASWRPNSQQCETGLFNTVRLVLASYLSQGSCIVTVALSGEKEQATC